MFFFNDNNQSIDLVMLEQGATAGHLTGRRVSGERACVEVYVLANFIFKLLCFFIILFLF